MEINQKNITQQNENPITFCDDVIKTIANFSSVNTVAMLQMLNSFFKNNLAEEFAEKKKVSSEETTCFRQSCSGYEQFTVLFHMVWFI